MLTGGLIRLRIYSAWGLTVLDVGKIAFITEHHILARQCLPVRRRDAYAPEAAAAVDHLPLWANRAIGLRALFAIVCYLPGSRRRRRTIGRAGWRIALPSFRFTLVQIAIGATDL